MAYNLKHNRGMIRKPVSFRDTSGLDAKSISESMKKKAEECGVPIRLTVDTVKEGGLFGNSYPCIVIEHPCPPQSYFTDVYIINGNSMNFYFFGESKANTRTNVAIEREKTFWGSIANVFAGSNEMALQEEMYWHNQVYDIYESMIMH